MTGIIISTDVEMQATELSEHLNRLKILAGIPSVADLDLRLPVAKDTDMEQFKRLLTTLNKIDGSDSWIELNIDGKIYIGTGVSAARPLRHETNGLT